MQHSQILTARQWRKIRFFRKAEIWECPNTERNQNLEEKQWIWRNLELRRKSKREVEIRNIMISVWAKSMDESALWQDDNNESAKYDNFDEECCICGLFGRNNEI